MTEGRHVPEQIDENEPYDVTNRLWLAETEKNLMARSSEVSDSQIFIRKKKGKERHAERFEFDDWDNSE